MNIGFSLSVLRVTMPSQCRLGAMAVSQVLVVRNIVLFC